MTGRTLSFKGCQSRAEAVARYRTWFEELYADNERKLETTMLTMDLGDASLDVDSIDASLEWSADQRHEVIDAAVKSFQDFLNRESIGPPELWHH